MLSKRLILLLLFFIVATTLINSDLFIYETLVAYFSYVILGAVLIGFAGLFLIRSRVSSYLSDWPIIIMAIWVIYILTHGLLVNNGLNFRHFFLIVSGLLFISLTIIFRTPDFKISYLYRALSLFVIVESVTCIAQYYGFIERKNSFFNATGTWGNPIVTAMFLAMALPAVWHMVLEETFYWKRLAIGAIISCIISLLLLNCQTAMIGAIVGTMVILYSYGFFHSWISIIRKRNYLLKTFLMLFVTGLFISVTMYFYPSGKVITDRALIWKISLQMVKDRPLAGYGYGMFERNYNLFQAEYFKEGNATQAEVFTADYVKTANNEVIENLVEGGIGGLMLYVGFQLSLIFYFLKNRSQHPSPGVDTSAEARIKKAFTNKNVNEQHVSSGHPALALAEGRFETRRLLKEPADALHSIKDGSYKTAALAGIVTFMIMSLFNFTLLAIPAMIIFIIYGGIIAASKSISSNPVSVNLIFEPFKKNSFSSSLKNQLALVNGESDETVFSDETYVKRNFTLKNEQVSLDSSMHADGEFFKIRFWEEQKRNILSLSIGMILLVVSIILLISQIQYCNAHFQLKKAVSKSKNNDISGAMNIFTLLDKKMAMSKGYLKKYTKTLMKSERYSEAIEQYEKAEKITSQPDIFIDKGYCYAKLGNISASEKCFQLAMNIQPYRFTPRFSLMKLYLQNNDSTRALEMAKTIVNIKSKVPTIESGFYKNEARKLLRDSKIKSSCNSSHFSRDSIQGTDHI